jgi:hypothetical protein
MPNRPIQSDAIENVVYDTQTYPTLGLGPSAGIVSRTSTPHPAEAPAMRRVTLRLEALDGRVLPSVVSGDVVITYRADYRLCSAPAASEVVTIATPGGKIGGAEEGNMATGGRGGMGGDIPR